MDINEEYKNQYLLWKAELIKITAEETHCHPHEVKINDEGAREWFDSGATPYQTFRETYANEG